MALYIVAGGISIPSPAHGATATATASLYFAGVVLFRVAGAVYFLADLLAAAAPVVVLGKLRRASGSTRRHSATMVSSS
jgi:hypothetical protein